MADDGDPLHEPGFRALRLVVAAVVLVLICGAGLRAWTLRHQRIARRLHAPRMEWSYYEPRISEHTRPLGFRVGSGLVVMLDAMPPRVFLFDLAAPTHPLGGPVLSGDANRHLQIGLNGRVVGVTKPGVAWFLNHDRSDLISLDIGNGRHFVAHLDAGTPIGSACAMGEHAIAYIESGRPDVVAVRDLMTAAPTRWIGLDDSVQFGSVDDRFAGSLSGPCVLWSPSLGDLFPSLRTRPLGR